MERGKGLIGCQAIAPQGTRLRANQSIGAISNIEHAMTSTKLNETAACLGSICNAESDWQEAAYA